jgi:hypothetical protein
MGRRGRPIDQYASLEADIARGLGVVLHWLSDDRLAASERARVENYKKVLEDGLAKIESLRRH